MVRKLLLLLFAAGVSPLAACSPDDPKPVTTTDEEDGGDSSINQGQTPPAPYDSLRFEVKDVEVNDPTLAAGWHGKLLRASDGALYYVYLKGDSIANTGCDRAIFGGGAAPAIRYKLKVAVKAPAAADFTVETIDAQPGDATFDHVAGRLGLDATLDNNQLVVASPGGGGGQFTCASSDLLLARRVSANNYVTSLPVVGSGSCCAVGTQAELCSDPACTQGTDAGYWPTIATKPGGGVAVAYVDAHFVTDQDGQSARDFELYDESGGVTGIRPWSNQGLYGAMVFVGSTQVLAFTSFSGGGLTVLRRATGATAWTGSDIRPNWRIGERIQLAVAGNGTIGMVFYAMKDDQDRTVDDLYYCSSTDGGVTWSTPCERIDQAAQSLGANPSLAFTNDNHPVVSYYFCGSGSGCANDGLRYAWRDDSGRWWFFDVHNVANNRSGTYSSLVLDPSTNAPIIVFQDLTRGAASIAYGRFGN